MDGPPASSRVNAEGPESTRPRHLFALASVSPSREVLPALAVISSRMHKIVRVLFLACLSAMAAVLSAPAQSTPRAVYRNAALGFTFDYPGNFTDVSELYVNMFGPPRTAARSAETKFADCLAFLFVAEDANHNEIQIKRYDLSCMDEAMSDAVMEGGISHFIESLQAVFTGSTFSAHDSYELGGHRALLAKGTLPGTDGDLSVVMSCVAMGTNLVCWQITGKPNDLVNSLASNPVGFDGESSAALVPYSLIGGKTARPAAAKSAAASSGAVTTTVTHNSSFHSLGTVIQSPDHFTYSFPTTFVDKSAQYQAASNKARDEASAEQRRTMDCITEPFAFEHPDPAIINILRVDVHCMGGEPSPSTLRELVTSSMATAKAQSNPREAAPTFGELKSYSLGSHAAVSVLGHVFLGSDDQRTSLIITCVATDPSVTCWHIYAPWDDRAKDIAAYPVAFDGEAAMPLVPR